MVGGCRAVWGSSKCPCMVAQYRLAWLAGDAATGLRGAGLTKEAGMVFSGGGLRWLRTV